MYVSNSRNENYMSQKLIVIKVEVYKSTTIVEDQNSPQLLEQLHREQVRI